MWSQGSFFRARQVNVNAKKKISFEIETKKYLRLAIKIFKILNF